MKFIHRCYWKESQSNSMGHQWYRHRSYKMFICVSSGFHRKADENWILLDNYAMSTGNSLLKLRDNLSVQTLNDGTDKGKELPLNAV